MLIRSNNYTSDDGVVIGLKWNELNLWLQMNLNWLCICCSLKMNAKCIRIARYPETHSKFGRINYWLQMDPKCFWSRDWIEMKWIETKWMLKDFTSMIGVSCTSNESAWIRDFEFISNIFGRVFSLKWILNQSMWDIQLKLTSNRLKSVVGFNCILEIFAYVIGLKWIPNSFPPVIDLTWIRSALSRVASLLWIGNSFASSDDLKFIRNVFASGIAFECIWNRSRWPI